jgi:hypothetical protein
VPDGPALDLAIADLPGFGAFFIAFRARDIGNLHPGDEEAIGQVGILGQGGGVPAPHGLKCGPAHSPRRAAELRQKLHAVPDLLVDDVSAAPFQIQKLGQHVGIGVVGHHTAHGRPDQGIAEGCDQPPDDLRWRQVVGIEEHQNLGGGAVDRIQKCRRFSRSRVIGPVDDPHERMPRREVICNRAGPVARPVVDHDHLIAVGRIVDLGQTIKAALQHPFFVVGGHNHRDTRQVAVQGQPVRAGPIPEVKEDGHNDLPHQHHQGQKGRGDVPDDKKRDRGPCHSPSLRPSDAPFRS